ncbi:MAG: PilZ domain-containing protein [Pseudomonadota bacterium]
MNLRRSISVRLKGGLAAFAIAFGATPTLAQDACQTVGHTVDSLAVIQALSADPESRSLSRRLQRSVASIQASGLTQTDTNALSLTEQTALRDYITALQQAAAIAEAGSVADARTIVAPHVNAALFSSLENLELQWECLPEEAVETTVDERETSGGAAVQPGSNGSGSGLGTPGNLANGTLSGPGLENSQGNAGRGVSFAQDAIVGGNVVAFYFMLLGFFLVGLVFYLSRRLRRQTEREARRVLDRPVKVFLNGSLHHLRLVDISMNGAKLGHKGEVSEDDDIGIDIGGTWHNAQVRWTNTNYAGVKFKKALDAFTVEQMA